MAVPGAGDEAGALGRGGQIGDWAGASMGGWPAMRGCTRGCPGGAMAVKPSVARGDGTYADPGAGRACGEEEPVAVETRGSGDATPGVDWT